MVQNIDIQILTAEDLPTFKALLLLFNDVFEEPDRDISPDAQLQKTLENTLFKVFVATQAGKVVGGLTVYELVPYYGKKSELFIYDVAVETALHNQGIGKRLISFLHAWAKAHHFDTIFVPVHTEDEQAVAFYQRCGMDMEDVRHFTLACWKIIFFSE